jgi:hypothetical protein
LFRLFLGDDDIASMVTATNAYATPKFEDKKVPTTTPTTIIYNHTSPVKKKYTLPCVRCLILSCVAVLMMQPQQQEAESCGVRESGGIPDRGSGRRACVVAGSEQLVVVDLQHVHN